MPKSSHPLKGVKKSPETRAKMSASTKKWHAEHPNFKHPPRPTYPAPPGAENYIRDHVPKYPDGSPMLIWSKNGKLRTNYTKNQQVGLPADYSIPHEYRVTPETRTQTGPICGKPNKTYSTKSGPICCRPAGWGTSHVGSGPCRYHGGALPSTTYYHTTLLEKAAMGTYGSKRVIDPHTAVLETVHRTAGHVEWLFEKIQALSDVEGDMTLHQYTSMGIKASVWVEMYERERMMLMRAAKAAVDMGVSERQVQLAEEQGRLIAGVLQKFIDSQELSLSPTQRAIAPRVIRELLTTMPQLPAPGTVVREQKSSNLAPETGQLPLDPIADDSDNDWEEF